MAWDRRVAEVSMGMTPRIDKPSLLTNRKNEPAFPQQRLLPGAAGALKPVPEQKET